MSLSVLMKTAATFLSLALLCTCSFAAPNICRSYADDLDAMLHADRAIREGISYDALPVGKVKESELPTVFQQMAIVDRVNTRRLKQFVHACGWPRKSIHGERATGAAWLLAQHSEPDAQRGFLPFLMTAVNAGEASPSDLAYLTDRIAAHDGRPQLYGTQMNQKNPCEFEFEPLDDRVKVNERRKSIGMPSLEEYELMFREYLSTRGCSAK